MFTRGSHCDISNASIDCLEAPPGQSVIERQGESDKTLCWGSFGIRLDPTIHYRIGPTTTELKHPDVAQSKSTGIW